MHPLFSYQIARIPSFELLKLIGIGKLYGFASQLYLEQSIFLLSKQSYSVFAALLPI